MSLFLKRNRVNSAVGTASELLLAGISNLFVLFVFRQTSTLRIAIVVLVVLLLFVGCGTTSRRGAGLRTSYEPCAVWKGNELPTRKDPL